MFCLRIHSLDSPLQPHPSSSSSSEANETSTSSSSSGSGCIKESFGIESIRGIIHLYRTAGPPPSLHSFPNSLFPAGRGTCLFVLAVPTRLSADDFLRFCGSYADRASGIRIVRNDALEDRYSVLVKFDDQENADAFYLNLNGWRFSSAEGEVCHILFLGSVEYTDLVEIADTPQVGSTELPTCPVCLERLDQDTSGIAAATCDHSFQCACISKWASSSCSVCQLCQKHSQKSACSVCGTSENLWICLICSFVGCGRYKEGHAFRHWKDTQHCYSLDLELQRVWDYVGDTYVHRLNQSKSDDKLGKLRSSGKYAGDNCESFECGDQSGISGTLLSSKVEAIVDEYNRLLASQLESQRQYYENLLEEEKEKRKKYISESVEKAVTLKTQDIQLEIDSVVKGMKLVADINENLVKNQNLWREKIKEIEDRERETLRLKNEKIHDLEEEIRDFTVFIGAQKVLDDMGDTGEIQGGTLLPVPAPPSSSRTNRSSKGNRRRK